MINKPKKNLPIRPTIVDGLTRFINLPKLRRKAKQSYKTQNKKDDHRPWSLIFLFSLSTLIALPFLPRILKTNNQDSVKKVIRTQTQIPTKLKVSKQNNYASIQPEHPSENYENINYDSSYELYEGTNSNNIDEPYMEDVGRYIANEENSN